jgi:signal transduction histidine kinase
MVVAERASFLLAILATLLYLMVVALEYLGILPHHHPPVLDNVEMFRQDRYLLTIAALLVVSLGLAAYLTSSLSASQRKVERDLRYRLDLALGRCQELNEINSRLQRLDTERTRFLTTVTHELRAPINTIHTCVELALAGYASPEKVREILERVKERTAELSDLISDLLRLARAREEASRDERIELVQPVEVLQSVVQLMKTEANSKDLFLSTDIDPDLASIQANAERLKLVWTNLLSNAIKYTEPGGIVGVTLKQTPEQLVSTVQDTGIGIPPEDLRRIFEEFYRAENARAVSPIGTGVGLAIVRRIVENWGGQITVESELGLGSKFTLVLPRADA